MPLVEVIHPQGAFDADGKKKLLESLSATCLRWEGIDVNDVTQSIAWVYLDERPRDSISAGGWTSRSPDQHTRAGADRAGPANPGPAGSPGPPIRTLAGRFQNLAARFMPCPVLSAILAGTRQRGDGTADATPWRQKRARTSGCDAHAPGCRGRVPEPRCRYRCGY